MLPSIIILPRADGAYIDFVSFLAKTISSNIKKSEQQNVNNRLKIGLQQEQQSWAFNDIESIMFMHWFTF